MIFNNKNNLIATSQSFMPKVYLWMCIGLALTGFISFMFQNFVLAINNVSFIILALVQFGLSMYFFSKWESLNFSSLAFIYILYSSINGLLFIPLFAAFTTASVFYVFLITAGMFAAMAIYGTVTKSDLSSMSSILFMGLIGLIIANLINIFVRSEAFNLVISCFGVGIFSMLIAYEIQGLQKLMRYLVTSKENYDKIALVGALQLYMSFINLFIYLLQIFGKRRN